MCLQQHTFQLSFLNHLGTKRKYLFSVSDSESKADWVEALSRRTQSLSAHQRESLDSKSKAIQNVALQVLRDSFIAPEESNAIALLKNQPAKKTHTRSILGRDRTIQRVQSISKLFPPGQSIIAAATTQMSGTSARSRLLAPEDSDERLALAKTGHEIVTLSEQNSLLPFVIKFVSLGLPSGATDKATSDDVPRSQVFGKFINNDVATKSEV